MQDSSNSAPWTGPAVTELTSAGRVGAKVICFIDNGLSDKWAFSSVGHFSGKGFQNNGHRNNKYHTNCYMVNT